MPLLGNGFSSPELLLLLLDQACNAAINLLQRPHSGGLRTCLNFRSNAPEVGHGVTQLDCRRVGRVLARARPI
eukprot:7992025-Alexandrium_andersonii.AAC.1